MGRSRHFTSKFDPSNTSRISRLTEYFSRTNTAKKIVPKVSAEELEGVERLGKL